jgi:hypothetical protein
VHNRDMHRIPEFRGSLLRNPSDSFRR